MVRDFSVGQRSVKMADMFFLTAGSASSFLLLLLLVALF